MATTVKTIAARSGYRRHAAPCCATLDWHLQPVCRRLRLVRASQRPARRAPSPARCSPPVSRPHLPDTVKYRLVGSDGLAEPGVTRRNSQPAGMTPFAGRNGVGPNGVVTPSTASETGRSALTACADDADRARCPMSDEAAPQECSPGPPGAPPANGGPHVRPRQPDGVRRRCGSRSVWRVGRDRTAGRHGRTPAPPAATPIAARVTPAPAVAGRSAVTWTGSARPGGRRDHVRDQQARAMRLYRERPAGPKPSIYDSDSVTQSLVVSVDHFSRPPAGRPRASSRWPGAGQRMSSQCATAS